MFDFTLLLLFKKYLGGSDEDSSRINAAASVLRSPHLRGLHMLKINGIKFDENASQPENDFLFQMMETNEEIDECHNLSGLYGK